MSVGASRGRRRAAPAAMLLASLMAASGAGAASLFVSVERPFLPGRPGAIVKLEVRGTRSVDVRLYRLEDPERFLAAQRDIRHLEAPAAAPSEEPAAASGGALAAPARPRRVAGAFALLGEAIAATRAELRTAVDRGASPAFRKLLRRALRGPQPSRGEGLPFLADLELVERWDFACGSSGGAYSYCDLDVGPRPAGTYLVEVVSGREAAHALVLFSSLSLVARRTSDSLAVLSLDSLTGGPLGSVRLSLLPEDAPTVHGLTRKGGLGLLEAPDRPALLVGRYGESLALLPVPAFGGQAEADASTLVLDAAEHAPGERVSFHGFLRAPGGSLPELDEAAKVDIAVRDGRGSVVFRDARELSAQAGFGGDFALPEGFARGLYRVEARAGPHHAEAELWVREVPEPAMDVAARLHVAAAGEPARAEVRVARAGAPLAGTELRWRVLRYGLSGDSAQSPEELHRGQATTDAGGAASFEFPTVPGEDARYELSLLATDADGREVPAETSATVFRSPLRAALEPESRLVEPGRPARIRIRLSDAAGRPAGSTLSAEVFATRLRGEVEERTRILAREVRVPAGGTSLLEFVPATTGYLEVVLARGKTRLAESYLYVTRDGGDIPFTPDTLALVPDRDSYSIGDTARLLVLSPVDEAAVLVTVEGDGLLRHDALAVRRSSAVLRLKITRAFAPSFTVAASTAREERSWHCQRALPVGPGPGRLAIEGSWLEVAPGAGRLELVVTDAAGRPAGGAEVFAVVRDARAPAPLPPPLVELMHPPRIAEGFADASTGYRNSSHGRLDGAAVFEPPLEEGFAPFKGMPQAPPRRRDAGTLVARAATADAEGRVRLDWASPADCPSVQAVVVAVDGAAAGEWNGTFERRGPVAALEVPGFLRLGDRAVARACTTEGAEVELTDGETSTRSLGCATLPLVGHGVLAGIRASFSGSGALARTVPIEPAAAIVRSGESGHAPAGASKLPLAAEGERSALLVTTDPLEAARSARRAMGETPEPTTAGAIGRLLARLAEAAEGPLERIGAPAVARALGTSNLGTPAHPVSARASAAQRAWHSAAQRDVGRLAALAHPEGAFGTYDGAPADLALTSHALAALALARAHGLEVDPHLLESTAEHLRPRATRTPLAGWALASAGVLSQRAAGALAESAAKGEASLADQAFAALALRAARDRRASAAATRLERGVLQHASKCVAGLPCALADQPLEALGAAALALGRGRGAGGPAATALALALVQRRQRGDFGGGVGGGLAALGLVAVSGSLPPPGPATVAVESGGRRLPAVPVGVEGERRIELPALDATIHVAGGPVYWKLEREAETAVPALGALTVTREFASLDRPQAAVEQEGLRLHERVRVTLRIDAPAATGAVRIDDPYPAGLAPLEQEGDEEPFKQLHERARRLLLPDRVVFLLPGLAAGTTRLTWEATARVAGDFGAAPVRVDAGELWGRSGASRVRVEAAP